MTSIHPNLHIVRDTVGSDGNFVSFVHNSYLVEIRRYSGGFTVNSVVLEEFYRSSYNNNMHVIINQTINTAIELI